jgi:hypothetical protein
VEVQYGGPLTGVAGIAVFQQIASLKGLGHETGFNFFTEMNSSRFNYESLTIFELLRWLISDEILYFPFF